MKTIGQPAKNPLRISIYWTVICFAMICLLATNVMAQTLGNYPNKTITAGLNTTVVPAAAPVGASSVVAYTHTNFSGQLTVNPTTGVVYVTNAKQAGTYTVTVKAFGAGTVTKTFTLTVTNPLCSQGNLGDSSTIALYSGGFDYIRLAIADLNNDGKQDMVNKQGKVKLGDGKGGFTEGSGFVIPPFFPIPIEMHSIAIGDLNGDGRQDVIGGGSNDSMLIWLGDGTGGFSAAQKLGMPLSIGAISLGDFNADGRLDLAAGFANEGLVFIRLGDGTGGFTGSTQVAVSGTTYAIAIGDFNKDGKQDWVTSAGSVRLGDGLGGFSGNTELSIAGESKGLALADFNGDGNQDLAFGNAGTSVPIRLGNGNGGFTNAPDVPFTMHNAGFAVTGDFNGDGKTDLAVASTSTANPREISIKLGNGAGGFTGGTILSLNQVTKELVAGDFNGDGRHDLAAVAVNTTALYFGLKPMLVKGDNLLIADGDNTPAPADFTDFGTVNTGASFARTFTITNNRTDNLLISSITSSNARFVVSGAPTMVAPGSTAGFLVRFSPNAAGSQSAVITINNNDICGETVFDFTVTGKTSGFTYSNTSLIAGLNTSISPTGFPANAVSAVAIASSSFTGSLSVNPSNGLLRITNAKNAGSFNITVHAFNGNGEVLAPATFTLTVTNPLCSQGNLGDSSTIALNSGGIDYIGLAIADLNNDGIQDWVTANGKVKLGDGKGGFTDGTGLEFDDTSQFINSIAIGDLNSDGMQDVIGGNYYNLISIQFGDGTGGFSAAPNLGMPASIGAISLGDFNADGRLDLAAGITNANGAPVFIRLGDGTGGFTGSTQVAVSGTTYAISIGDFNKDGKQDLVTSAGSVRLGDGLGGFSGSTELSIAGGSKGLAIADFNGDGNQDLAFGNTGTSVPIRLGNGNGGFTNAPDVPFTMPNAGFAVTGDFNGDGKTDLAVASTHLGNPREISIKLGNGAGGFTGGTILSVNQRTRELVAGDFNGDGRHDLAAVGATQTALYFGLKPTINTWLGTISSDWNNASNWSLGMVPNDCTSAEVNAGSPNMPVVTGTSNTCFSLKMGTGATITVQPGSRLNITGKTPPP